MSTSIDNESTKEAESKKGPKKPKLTADVSFKDRRALRESLLGRRRTEVAKRVEVTVDQSSSIKEEGGSKIKEELEGGNFDKVAAIAAEHQQKLEGNLVEVGETKRENMADIRAFAEMQIGLAKNFPEYFSITKEGELTIDTERIGLFSRPKPKYEEVFDPNNEKWKRQREMLGFVGEKLENIIDKILKRAGGDVSSTNADILFGRDGDWVDTAMVLGTLYLFNKNAALEKDAREIDFWEHPGRTDANSMKIKTDIQRVAVVYSGMMIGNGHWAGGMESDLALADACLTKYYTSRGAEKISPLKCFDMQDFYRAGESSSVRGMVAETLSRRLNRNWFPQAKADTSRIRSEMWDAGRSDKAREAQSAPEAVASFLKHVSWHKEIAEYGPVVAAIVKGVDLGPDRPGYGHYGEESQISKENKELVARNLVEFIFESGDIGTIMAGLKEMAPAFIGRESELILEEVSKSIRKQYERSREVYARYEKSKDEKDMKSYRAEGDKTRQMVEGLNKVFIGIASEIPKHYNFREVSQRMQQVASLVEWNHQLARSVGMGGRGY